MNKLYQLLAACALLFSFTASAQTTSPQQDKQKYTSIKIGPSLTTLAIKDASWQDMQPGAHAGLYFLFMENDKFGIQTEVQYSLQGAGVEQGHLTLHYINVPVLAKYFIEPKVSLQGGAYAGLLLSQRFARESRSAATNLDSKDYGLAYGISFGNESKATVSLRHQVGLANINDAKNQAFQLSVSYCLNK